MNVRGEDKPLQQREAVRLHAGGTILPEVVGQVIQNVYRTTRGEA